MAETTNEERYFANEEQGKLHSSSRLCAPVLVIVGPTASGKSELAQLVARGLNGEVISVDSMQIYKGMDIGTAKVSPRERTVTHHMIDIVDPGQAFSVQQFQFMARQCINNLQQRNTPPVLCGGTGLYLQAVLEDMRFPKGEYASSARSVYQTLHEQYGSQYLWDLLDEKDHDSALCIHPNNTRRVIRALEMADEGVSYAAQSAKIRSLPEVIPSLKFGIAYEPQILNKRINLRVEDMFKAGLIDEVETLLQLGFEHALTAREAIGYKEVVAYLQGSISLEEAKEQIKLATRRYAKRQRSWFRRDKNIVWLDAQQYSIRDMSETILLAYQSAKQDKLDQHKTDGRNI